MKTLTKKVLQLIPTLFCVVALSGVNPAWAKHCQSWNVACKKAEQLQEEAERQAANAAANARAAAERAAAERAAAENAAANARAAAERAAANAKAEAEKARANPKQYAENAGKAVAKGVNQAAKRTVNLAAKGSVSRGEITKAITKNAEGIWYSPWPGNRQKVRLQSSFGSGADSPTNITTVAVTRQPGDGNRNWPPEVQRYGPYFNDRPGEHEQTPLKVSHRQRQSSVDNQGNRGTCMAFATAAAFESLLGNGTKISKEYVYSKLKNGDQVRTCKGYGVVFPELRQVLQSTKFFPEEKYWNYMETTFGKQGVGACPGDPPEVAKNNAVWRVTGTAYHLGAKEYMSVSNPAFIEAWLAAGYDVIIGVGVAWTHETFLKVNSTETVSGDLRNLIDVKKVNGNAAPSEGLHAMLIVGYERTNDDKIGGGYFTLKNSWGTDKGKGGYLRLSYDYIRQYASDGMVITAVGN